MIEKSSREENYAISYVKSLGLDPLMFKENTENADGLCMVVTVGDYSECEMLIAKSIGFDGHNTWCYPDDIGWTGPIRNVAIWTNISLHNTEYKNTDDGKLS